jgi:hypothetical protein
MENPYRITGREPIRLLGRKAALEGLARHLAKKVPDCVSVIGPKLIGKTVLLNELVPYLTRREICFTASIYWDMKQGTPNGDQAFYQQFASLVKEELLKCDTELAKQIDSSDKNLASTLKLVFQLLNEDKKNVLAVLDGLDELLSGTEVTRNLWDYMRDLASLPSLVLVTGTRLRPSELCASPEVRTSPFWNIFFDTPVQLGPFEEAEWNEVLNPLVEAGHTIDPSGLKEIQNWSGGVPVLVSALGQHLWEKYRNASRKIAKNEIDAACEELLQSCQNILDYLWNDCSTEEQEVLFDLAKRGELPNSQVPNLRRESLAAKGYIFKTGGIIKSRCRLMINHALSRGGSLPDLRRLFGDGDRYQENTQSLLELRLAQLKGLDKELAGFVEKAIRDLAEPSHAVVWIRNVADRALDYVWEQELPSGEIPRDWTQTWKAPDLEGNAPSRYPPEGKIPTKRGQQCNLLRLMTDSRNAVKTKVSYTTYLLIDHLQSVGDFGQHRQSREISFGFGVAVCFAAIQLCEQLVRDFNH